MTKPYKKNIKTERLRAQRGKEARSIIRQLLRKKNIAVIARETGTEWETISAWYAGSHVPGPKKLKKLRKYLEAAPCAAKKNGRAKR